VNPVSSSGDVFADALYHWHPVLRSADLGQRPVGVKVLGQQLVLFRAANGLAALDDRCPHRGARLSTGSVKDGCVVCPYHLWSFDAEGRGRSPVNQRMKPFTRAYDVSEFHGLVWVKQRDSDAALPEIQTEGMNFMADYTGVIEASFPIVVDNFTEIEHSPTNHFLFAFDAEGIKHVEPQVEVLDDHIHVIYAGPQRPYPWWTFAGVMGMKAGNRLVIDFRMKFSPLHWIYDMYWEDPVTGQRLPRQHIREFAFITPHDEKSTTGFLLLYTENKLFSPANPILGLLRRMFVARAGYEYLLDKRICENVAGIHPTGSLDGFQLGKFDHVLRVTRKLIHSVYYRQATEDPLRRAMAQG